MEFFELMAECSVALGGFAAVHAALRGSQGPRGTFRAWGTVSWAFTALWLALVPLVFGLERELDGTHWRWIYGVGLVPAGASAALAVWLDVQLKAAGHAAQIRVNLRSAQGLGLGACTLLAAGIVGWPLEPSPTVYAAAVAAQFLSAVLGIIASFWLAMRDAIEAGAVDASRDEGS